MAAQHTQEPANRGAGSLGIPNPLCLAEGKLRLRTQDQVKGHQGHRHNLTLSSPAATLKASSTRQPTAMRTALDECISFHTVSLSTYGGQQSRLQPAPCRGKASTGDSGRHLNSEQVVTVGGKGGRGLGEPLYSPRCPHKAAWHTSSG